ncbi:MAG: hypothetical protein D6798_19635, partial [Deltaproteobacteria bacterium]
PRLQRVVAALPGGFDIQALVDAIHQSLPWRFRQAIGLEFGSDSSLSLSLDSDMLEEVPPEPEVGGSWDCFEVLGGPDDGLWIDVRPGLRLGRHSTRPKADVRLFQGSQCRATGVSRLHVEVLDGDRIRAHRRCPGLLGATHSGPLDAGAEVTLQAGDIVRLGAGVALCARRDSRGALR